MTPRQEIARLRGLNTDLVRALELIERRMVQESVDALELSTNEIDCLIITRAALAKARQ